MAATAYLAMTASEFDKKPAFPPNIAWMACHFSLYGTGLTNLPSALPVGSLLMLNDRIPFREHDPVRITEQILPIIETMECSGVLLDFQQPFTESLQNLAVYLSDALPCPVAITEAYAAGTDSPVFLSPCPHHIHLDEHIAPWKGNDIWLDLAADAETITLTKDGPVVTPYPAGEVPEGGHREQMLHCHYRTEIGADYARFTLWRTQDDLEALAREAEDLGVKALVGLWQELYCANTEKDPSR